LPQGPVSAGQSGHLNDHGNIKTDLQTLWGAAAQGMVNVVAPPYNADPTGVADSTSAINSALAAAAANGSCVYFPNGSYKITSTITISTTGTQLVGGGWGSQILYDGNVVAVAFNATGNIRFCMQDLRISQTNASHLGTALDLSQCNSGTFDRLLIDGGGGSGVAPLVGVKMSASTCHYNTLRDCSIHYGGASSTGVTISGSANSNVLDNVHCLPQSDDAASSGIYITSAHSTTMLHPDVESGAGNGIFLDTAAHGTKIYAAYLDSNNINIKISNGVIAPVVDGGTVEGGVTANVQDNGSVSPCLINLWPNSGSTSYSNVALTNVAGFNLNGVQVPPNMYQAADLGFLAWAYDPALTSNSTLTTNGTIYLARVVLRYAATISKLAIGIATAASSPVANESYLGLYDSGGTLRASTAAGTLDTLITSSGLLNASVATPYSAAAGVYWVAFVNNAGTAATIARNSGLSLSIANGGAAASSYRFAVNGTGQTSLPSTITPGNNTLSGATTMWASVS
jgi:hypothetical protein